MNTKPNHITCANPACRRQIHRRDAYLRSLSLKQVAFCSLGCVEVFDALDKAARMPVEQRRAVRS